MSDSVHIQITVSFRVRDWLTDLAELGIYGRQPTAVAEHFVREAIARELRPGGFLHTNPPGPRSETSPGEPEE